MIKRWADRSHQLNLKSSLTQRSSKGKRSPPIINLLHGLEDISFDEIKKTVLSEDGKTLFILGNREGKDGMWELKLQ